MIQTVFVCLDDIHWVWNCTTTKHKLKAIDPESSTLSKLNEFEVMYERNEHGIVPRLCYYLHVEIWRPESCACKCETISSRRGSEGRVRRKLLERFASRGATIHPLTLECITDKQANPGVIVNCQFMTCGTAAGAAMGKSFLISPPAPVLMR